MNNVSGNLIIVDANTPNMKVFFKGVQVNNVCDLFVNWDASSPKVILTLKETEEAQALKDYGIQVRRV